MRSIILTVLALALSVSGNPVVPQDAVIVKRDFASQSAALQTLHDAVFARTALINSTLASVSVPPRTQAAHQVMKKIKPDLNAITAAIKTATAAIKTAKRSSTELAGRQAACDAACLEAEIIAVVNEIASTVKTIVTTLGLGGLLTTLHPLLNGLGTLVLELDALVTGLLLTVTALVAALLAGLGLALGGL